MRFLLKILFAPILAVLAVVTWFFVFVVSLSSGILCIPAAILGFFGLFIIFVDSVSYGAGLLVIAFLISPYGLPMLATWLLAKLHVHNVAERGKIIVPSGTVHAVIDGDKANATLTQDFHNLTDFQIVTTHAAHVLDTQVLHIPGFHFFHHC